ncbi:MAG TPA: FAD-dependent oxidoreductase [Cyclobacteriaceae bacterium]|nr:FAD-dependent oxidoreductase [Cyclobacteriaceae bacterium]
MYDRENIKTYFDHIIVGQGLAGSCLALQLARQGKKILVFDEPGKNRASAVAAGLFNPITGKFLKPAWMADRIFPYLFDFYREAEKLLGHKFFFPQPIYRPFVSIEEQNEWMARSEDPGLKKLIAAVFTQSTFSNQVNDPFGGVLTQQSGYLDTTMFMRTVAEFLEKRDALRREFFDPGKLIVGDEKVSYENCESSQVIFCDGLSHKTNSFFTWLPIRPLKGETLTLTLEQSPLAIFNRGVYMVPTKKESEFLVGATHHPGDLTEGVTPQSRLELDEKVKGLIRIPYRITHQNWGMRPTTPDRRPILGGHPEFKKLIIFNGLGTKGVSLGPYFSGLLAAWLEGQSEIPFETNIERFKSLYSKFSFAKL